MKRFLRAATLAAALVAAFLPEADAAGTSAWVNGNGQGLTYGSAGFTASNFNSLATGSVVVATSAINNSTALDIYSDVSFVVTVGGTTTVASYLALYILPLNQDASTYGDGTSTGSTVPGASYLVSTVTIPSGVTTGNTITGTFRGVILPPGQFKFAVANQLAAALNSSAAATFSYRSYNENLNR